MSVYDKLFDRTIKRSDLVVTACAMLHAALAVDDVKRGVADIDIAVAVAVGKF